MRVEVDRSVIPAKAGIHFSRRNKTLAWVPASAGTTLRDDAAAAIIFSRRLKSSKSLPKTSLRAQRLAAYTFSASSAWPFGFRIASAAGKQRLQRGHDHEQHDRPDEHSPHHDDGERALHLAADGG